MRIVLLAVRSVLLCGLLLSGLGYANLPETGVTTLAPANPARLQQDLLGGAPNLDTFRVRGPFEVVMKRDVELQVSPKERIKADLFLSGPADRAPLVILLHGYGNSKDDHAYQALHLASWGIHSMTVQLRNRGPWVGNGNALLRLVRHVRTNPAVLENRVDITKIILAGHSFGATSVVVALAGGAPVAGGILLDPADAIRGLAGHLRKVRTPVMVLASDSRVNTTRNRPAFYRHIPRNVAEISITDAQHEDAQFPLEADSQLLGDSPVTQEIQITFVSAITSTAFSLGATGNLDYAWSSFREATRQGRLFAPAKK
jgi:pimeloyl-ACP methyl ester carboxylesterase